MNTNMNKNCEILFVYPPSGWVDSEMVVAENDAPPLGLLYVVSAARQAGLTVAVIDMNHPQKTDKELIADISQINPNIVAFSVLSTTSFTVKKLSERIKNSFPNIKIVTGGIHPTVHPGDMLSSKIDYVVLGEGEQTIVKLAQRIIDDKSIDDIPGIAFLDIKKNNNFIEKDLIPALVQTSRPLCINNLDVLPLPARDLVPITDYGQSGAICSSRGCPHSCSFCSSVLTSGHRYRKRATSNVIAELDHMHQKYGIDRFQIIDDNFACDISHATTISKILLDREYIWSCQTSVMEFASNLSTLDLMYKSGCREIYFGLESGCKRILNDYKGIDLDIALSILDYSVNIHKKHNNKTALNRLQVVVGFIIGHPEDDEQSIEETIQLATQLRSKGIDTMLSILQPYPGSLIHNYPDRYKVTIKNKNYKDYLYPKSNISTKFLSRNKIRDLYASGLFRIMKTYKLEDANDRN